MFFLAKIQNSPINVPSPESFPAASGEEITQGQALVLADGVLTKCGATEKPQFIAMTSLKKSAEKRDVPTARADKNQIWLVPCDDDPTALKPGDKVTLGKGATTVTATTAGGTITVDNTNGAKKAGDKIYVRII
jgi:hypothetical protein